MARVLVAGWFSFESCNATAGDVITRDVLCGWLDEAGIAYDVATAPPFAGGCDWRAADPEAYSHVIFVCGPFRENSFGTEFVEHFRRCRLIGLNLSMIAPLEHWNPFDLLFERDSNRNTRPDLSFLAQTRKVPLIGLILVHRQKEYGQRALHEQAERVIHEVIAAQEAAVVPIDTRIEDNFNALSDSRQIESVIARMDAVVTTRLHGTVLALKNGVPAVAVDPIAGGAKITAQCEAIGWPHCFTADRVENGDLARALEACLRPCGLELAMACRERAARALRPLQTELLRALDRDGRKDPYSSI